MTTRGCSGRWQRTACAPTGAPRTLQPPTPPGCAAPATARLPSRVRYTLCTLLRAQQSVGEALRVWQWGNKQGIRRDARAWHHLIEAHIRHGRPGRAEALLGLHRRDESAPLGVYAHNLHLRALVASGEPQRALSHFERMLCAEEGGGEAAPPPAEAAPPAADGDGG